MFKKITIPLDRSPLAEAAIARGAQIARETGAMIDVVLVHVPVNTMVGTRNLVADGRAWDAEHQYVEAIVGELRTGAGVPATHGMLRGEPVDMISRRAHETGSDLVVMTSHGRTGFGRAWLGSVADGVIRRSSVPVLMLRPPTVRSDRFDVPRPFEQILVPLDPMMTCDELLEAVASLARCGGASVTLLHVVQPLPKLLPESDGPIPYPPSSIDDDATQQLVDEAMADLDQVARRFFEPQGVHAHVNVVVESSVAQAILEFVRTNVIDLIAMATHGRGASRLVIGSVADKVLRGSGVPMLVYRPAARGEPEEHPVNEDAFSIHGE